MKSYFVDETLLGDVVFYSVIEDSIIDHKINKQEIGMFINKNDAEKYSSYGWHMQIDNDERPIIISDELMNWMKIHSEKCKSHGTAGEHYEFIFENEKQTIKCIICKESFESEYKQSEKFFVDRESRFDPVFIVVYDENRKIIGFFNSIENAERYAFFKNNENAFKEQQYFLLSDKLITWMKIHRNACKHPVKLSVFPTGIAEFQKVECSECNESFEDEI